MLTIVIPMAGAGARFAQAGYAEPKPLIPVHGVPMIRLVIANLRPRRPHRFVFIVQRGLLAARPDLAPALATWAGLGQGREAAIAEVDGLTEGAACTVLTARRLMPEDAPLLIANCDQWVDQPVDPLLDDATAPGRDGTIQTMRATDPKWSFVRRNAQGWVEEVREKVPISDEATVGLYHFARAGDFVRGAEAMIAADERVNGEFYVAPVYNRLIAAGARIATVNVGEEGRGMHGLGTPADLEAFLRTDESRRAAAIALAEAG